MDLSKLLRLPGPTALAAFIASAGISWGYSHNVGLLRTIPVREIVYANLGIFVFGAIALVWFLNLAVKFIFVLLSIRQDRQRTKNYLSTLDRDESELLFGMRMANQQSITRSIMDPVATRLKQKGLLLPGGGVGNAMNWPYAIPTHVWKELGRRVRREFGTDQRLG